MAKKNKDEKKKNHISFRSMIIAMVAALLAFLGIGNFNLGNGDGVDVVGNQNSGIVSEENNGEVAELESETGNELRYDIYVREDKVIVLDGENEVEVSLDELKVLLEDQEEGTKVTIINDGAFKVNIDEVEELVNGYSHLVK